MEHYQEQAKALEGVTVLDLTRLLPGGFASMILADFGANVIKIEPPGQGDYCRNTAPLYTYESAYFMNINRNKRSMVLNLKDEQGKAIFKEMVKRADVVFEGNRPGKMKELELDYETLAEINPRIIYCSLSGYGQTGPYRDKAGHDLNYIGYAGVLEGTGLAGGPPAIPLVQIADLVGGTNAVVAILLALQARQHTGRGQYLDIAMADGVIAWLGFASAYYMAGKPTPPRGQGRLNGGYPCYAIYPTQDGYITVGALEKKFWVGLCRKLEREDLIPRQYDTGPEIREILTSIFQTHPTAEWLELLSGEDQCVGPVNDMAALFSDPHTLARDMLVTFEHPREGTIRMPGSALKLSDTPPEMRLRPPLMGEHTIEILSALGYSPSEIDKLVEQAVVAG